jgi:hypothetical protein
MPRVSFLSFLILPLIQVAFVASSLLADGTAAFSRLVGCPPSFPLTPLSSTLH